MLTPSPYEKFVITPTPELEERVCKAWAYKGPWQQLYYEGIKPYFFPNVLWRLSYAWMHLGHTGLSPWTLAALTETTVEDVLKHAPGQQVDFTFCEGTGLPVSYPKKLGKVHQLYPNSFDDWIVNDSYGGYGYEGRGKKDPRLTFDKLTLLANRLREMGEMRRFKQPLGYGTIRKESWEKLKKAVWLEG